MNKLLSKQTKVSHPLGELKPFKEIQITS